MGGKLVIFSAPSGSGKTTLVKTLLNSFPILEFSISVTSRNPRKGEVNGKDYYFISPEEFRQKIKNNAFAEWEEVYQGTFYGTLKSEIERIWQNGKHVIFDVDVVGGLNLKEQFGQQALSIFVSVPSIEELAKRLRKRSTDSEEIIQKRLAKARKEMEFAQKFDVMLLNEDLPVAIAEAKKILQNFLEK